MRILSRLKDSIWRTFIPQNRSKERYQHQKKLGSGATGDVWLASDTLLNRPVAIKYLKATENTLHKELFLSEAQMLARLNHPNITLIYDATFDQKRNSFHLVMEYVEGRPLSDLISEQIKPLPLDKTLDIAIGTLQALQSAHNQGIVHRDVKPANIMLRKDQVKLTDFGVAGLMSLLSDNPRRGVGSLYYMSPEQIRGGTIDGRADLYALGVTMFQMISGGHLPFDRETRDEMIEAHLHELPPSLREFTPDVPLALEHTILKLLAKEPGDRFSSARAAIAQLMAIRSRLKLNQPHLNLLDAEARSLAGREKELAQLNTAWLICRENLEPHLLIIRGRAGIGKSSLVTTFVGQYVVDQGFVAVVGRSNPSGTPYTPFAEILATILSKRLYPSVTAEQLDLLLRHIPGLARLLNLAKPAVDSPEAENAQAMQWQFFTTILTILTELGPTVIFLEDATTLDEASVALIQFLIRQPQLPLLIIAASRPDPEQEAGSWQELFSTDEKDIITLAVLSTEAVKTVLEDLLGGPVPDRLVPRVKQRSQGIPLHIEEATRQSIDSGELKQGDDGLWRYRPPTRPRETPTSLSIKSVLGVFSRRIEKLSEQSREALAIGALIEPGAEFDFDVWLKALGGEPQREFARTVLDEGLRERLIRQVSEQRYIFHPKDLAVLFTANLAEDELRQAHRQIADILSQQEAAPVLIGYHYEQAGSEDEAAHFLEIAAAEAETANAVKTAIDYYNRVINLSESLTAFKALGRLYRQQGEWDNSIVALQQALEVAEEANDVTAQAQVLNSLSFTLWLYDDYQEAYDIARTVLELEGVSEIDQATAQSHLGMISWLIGELREAEEWCQKSVRILEQQQDEANLAGACNRLGLVQYSQGKLREAYRVVQQSTELRKKLGDYWGYAFSLNNMSRILTDQGDFEQAQAHLDTARELFEQVNSQDGLMSLYTSYGRIPLFQKRPQEALNWFIKAEQFAMKIGKHTAYGLSYIYLLQAQAKLDLDDVEVARTLTDEALELVRAAENREYIARALLNLAQIEAAAGDQATAAEIYQQAMALYEQIGSQTGWLRTRLKYAQFLARQGQSQLAADLETETRAEAARIGAYLP